MLVPSRLLPRVPRRRRPAATAGALGGLLLVIATACSAQRESQDPPAATPPPTSEPTPLADYDTSGITVSRSAFCERVPDEAVTVALSDEPSGAQAWRPGGRLPDTKAISNEFGCEWTAGPVTARAWVFAPPITSARAADLAEEVVGTMCRTLRSAPQLGEPGVAQSCTLNTGVTVVGFHGLVGDAWVSCELSGPRGAEQPDPDLVGEWCVAVLEALRST